jgi:nucleoside-diphosphate-sugar epimerase
MGKRILAITGGTGFLGRNLIDVAMEDLDGWEIRAHTTNLNNVHAEDKAKAEWTALNLVDESEGNLARIESFFRGADLAVHIAGETKAVNEFASRNVDMAGIVARAVASAGVERFVHISSLTAQRPDASQYGRSKAAGEKMVKVAFPAATILRPTAIHGPYDVDAYPLFREVSKASKWVTVPNSYYVSFVHAKCLARLALKVGLDSECHGKQFDAIDPRHGVFLAIQLQDKLRKMMPDLKQFEIRPTAQFLMPAVQLVAKQLYGDLNPISPDRLKYMFLRLVEEAPLPEHIKIAVFGPEANAEDLSDTFKWYVKNEWFGELKFEQLKKAGRDLPPESVS